MKKINLIFGLFIFLIFVLTGLYLGLVVVPENLDNPLLRMEARANHIYILSVALLNILSFGIPKPERLCFDWSHSLWRGLLIVSGMLVVAAFIFEHQKELDLRLLTTLSLFTALGAVIVFFFETVFQKKNL